MFLIKRVTKTQIKILYISDQNSRLGQLTVDGEEVPQSKAVHEAIKLVELENSWVD